MKLLTKEILKKLPKIGSTDKMKKENIRVYLKLFTPWDRWTWYVTEYDPESGDMFGYVKSGLDPNFDELGYSNINELMDIRGPFGLKVERDRYWDDKNTLAKVMESDRVL